MRRSKKAYINYVCPYCWNTLNKCTCELFPPYHLIFIDENIQEHIRLLNEKGYRTMYCCEGHSTEHSNTYISFADDYFKEVGTPSGFNYDKKRRTISYSYSTKLTKEKLEEVKKEKLAELLDWCKSLPNKNVDAED